MEYGSGPFQSTAKPSQVLDLQHHTLALSFLVKVFVRELLRTEDMTDLPEISIVEGIDLIHVPLYNSSAFRALQKTGLDITVVEFKLCSQAMLFGLPDELKSCE